jgi:hypothetical protein
MLVSQTHWFVMRKLGKHDNKRYKHHGWGDPCEPERPKSWTQAELCVCVCVKLHRAAAWAGARAALWLRALCLMLRSGMNCILPFSGDSCSWRVVTYQLWHHINRAWWRKEGNKSQRRTKASTVVSSRSGSWNLQRGNPVQHAPYNMHHLLTHHNSAFCSFAVKSD